MDSGLNISHKPALKSGYPDDNHNNHYPKQSRAKFFLRYVNMVLFEIKKIIIKSFHLNTPRKLLSDRLVHADLPANKNYFECQAKIRQNLKLFHKPPILLQGHEKAHPNHFLFDPARDIKPELVKHISSALDKNVNHMWVLKIDKNNNPVLRIGFEHEVDGLIYGHPTLIDDDESQLAIIGGELQETIARKIPREAHRPTIDLFIRGKKAGDHTKVCTLGVLGGVGPLSDAYIMKRAFQNLKKQSVDMDHMVVNVLSCPPPRTAKEIIKYGIQYVKTDS